MKGVIVSTLDLRDEISFEIKKVSNFQGVHLIIPKWGIEHKFTKDDDHKYSIYKALDMMLEKLDLTNYGIQIEIFPNIPIAMGLGSSAALAVSILRALSNSFKLKLNDDEINKLAFESEKIIHGSTSGLDNILATHGKLIFYQKSQQLKIQEINVSQPIPMVIGLTGIESLTVKMVNKVRTAWEKNKPLYENLFKEIDQLSLNALSAIENYDLETLGELMNINQGILNALQVSSSELEELVEIARNNGSIGAKLTGAGGGGAMIALCPDETERVANAIRKAGYEAMVIELSS